MRIDEQTENPFCRQSQTRKFWAFENQRKKQIETRKRRREIQTRIGKIKLYEELGRLIWNAYPYGRIFDIKTGELVEFSDRPSLFIKVAVAQAERAADDWVQRRVKQR